MLENITLFEVQGYLRGSLLFSEIYLLIFLFYFFKFRNEKRKFNKILLTTRDSANNISEGIRVGTSYEKETRCVCKNLVVINVKVLVTSFIFLFANAFFLFLNCFDFYTNMARVEIIDYNYFFFECLFIGVISLLIVSFSLVIFCINKIWMYRNGVIVWGVTGTD